MLLNCGVGEDSWESLGLQEDQTSNPEGNQSWIFFGRTDAEAETPILWPSDAKNWRTGKDPHARENWRQEEKGTTEDEMVGWHRWLDGHEFEQALGVADGQGSLVCCSPWGHKELNMSEQLNWLTEMLWDYRRNFTVLKREPCFYLKFWNSALFWCILVYNMAHWVHYLKSGINFIGKLAYSLISKRRKYYKSNIPS